MEVEWRWGGELARVVDPFVPARAGSGFDAAEASELCDCAAYEFFTDGKERYSRLPPLPFPLSSAACRAAARCDCLAFSRAWQRARGSAAAFSQWPPSERAAARCPIGEHPLRTVGRRPRLRRRCCCARGRVAASSSSSSRLRILRAYEHKDGETQTPYPQDGAAKMGL